MDWGVKAIEHCMSYWESAHPEVEVLGIHPTPADASEIYIYEKGGFKIAMLNYTYGLNGFILPDEDHYMIDMLDDDNKNKIAYDIRRAKDMADAVVVFPHWGTEYNLGVDDFQKDWAQFFADEEELYRGEIDFGLKEFQEVGFADFVPQQFAFQNDLAVAFAVLAVIFYHMGLGWAPGGLMGVTIFFVISGYLINGLLVAELGRVEGGRLTFANPCAMTNVSKFYFSGDPTSMSNAIGAPLVFPRVSSISMDSGWPGRKLHVYGAPFVFPQATFSWRIRDYDQSTFDADWVVSNVVVRNHGSNTGGEACGTKTGAGTFVVKGETSWYDPSVKSFIKIFSGCFWAQTDAGLPPSGEFYVPRDSAWQSTIGLSRDLNPMLDGSSTPRMFQESKWASWGFTGFGGERTVCWNADPTLNLTNTTSGAVSIPLGDAAHTNAVGKAYSSYYAYPAYLMFGNRSEFADGTILFLNPIRYEFAGQEWDAKTFFESTNHVVAARLRGSLRLGSRNKTWTFTGRKFGGYLALEADNPDFNGRVSVTEKGNLLVNSNLVARSVAVQAGSGLGGTGMLGTEDGTTVQSGGALFGGEWNRGGFLTLGGKVSFANGAALRAEVGPSNDRVGFVKLAADATLSLGSPVYVEVDTDPRVSPIRGTAIKVLDWSEVPYEPGAAPTRADFEPRPESNPDIRNIFLFVRDNCLYVSYVSVRYPPSTMLILR